MNGTNALFDSDVIILLSKRKINLDSLKLKYTRFSVSLVSFIEVYAFEFKEIKEREIIDRFFENVEIIEVNKEIADQTITYRKNKSKRIKLPDAIIIATAKYLGADLLTNNLSDFLGIDASVTVIGIEELRI